MKTLPIRAAEILAATDLLAEYAAECSIPLIGEINPQTDMYAALEVAGVLHCFGAYEENALIGFATVLTNMLPHYGKKAATFESLFVAKDSRKSGAGRSLMAAVKAFAGASGCTNLFYSAPAGGQLEKYLSAKKSCKRTNTIFCEKL